MLQTVQKQTGESSNPQLPFQSYANVIERKKHITMQTKIRKHKTMLVSCVIYGYEYWNCTKKDMQKN